MNWLTEKLNLTIIALFLIGLLVGGLAIGVVDVNRPKPLFSSADGGGSVLEDCQDEADTLVDFVESINNMEHPIEHSLWQNYDHQNYILGASVINCATDVAGAFYAEWEPEYASLNTELDQAREDLDVAGSYAYETSREAREAYNIWLELCFTNQGERSNATSVAPAGTDSKAGKEQSSILSSPTKNDNLDSDDCDELHEEYQVAYTESNRAHAEYVEIAQEVQRIEEQIAELDYELANFMADKDFTYQIGFETHILDEYGNPPLPPYYGGYGSGSRAY